MLAATDEYKAYEALPRGTTPSIRATFLPYYWSNGINADGEFNECAFVTPDRIQADYHGFTGGYWISPVLTANLQVPFSPAIASWNWNYPGFDVLLYWRGADSITALATTDWTLLEQGGTVQIYPYYQFMLTLEGYRAWAVEDPDSNDLWDDSDWSGWSGFSGESDDPDDFTAWAVDVAGVEAEEGYAAEENVPGDSLTYIEALQLLGEFTVMRDIEQAGSVSMEAPEDFSDLVAGSHSGLLLNNRQGAFVDSVWVPAPLFSPNKSSFFLSQQDWYDLQLKIELGWSKGGWFRSGFGEDEWLSEGFTDFVTLFLGKVKSWGPVNRAVGSPNNVEVYAEDFILDCLQKRICLPAADGTPAPLTYGEFLVQADPIIARSVIPPLKTATFEDNNFNELAYKVESGGGVFSIVTPGLDGISGTRAARATITGANQSAYGVLQVPVAGELFATGKIRFSTIPAAPANLNMTFLKIVDAAGVSNFAIQVYNTGDIYSLQGGQSKFNLQAYEGVPLEFGIWTVPGTPGHWRLWISGEEILTHDDTTLTTLPSAIHFGAITGGAAESWVIDFDDIMVWDHYHRNAFVVPGAPFAALGPVYLDNIAQPESKAVGAYTQTLIRLPEYGMVQFDSDDPEFEVSGDVMVRVVENAGGRHALAIITDLLDRAGLTPYIDAAALAAAYLAVPDDIINARFEGGAAESRGLKDYASLGLPIADALKEICSRCLYWIFVDAGNIKIVPYTAAPLVTPTDPLQILTASNKWENSQVIDLANVHAFVTVIYGWYDRNPAFNYVAGTQEPGGQGIGLDFSWGGAVATENRLIAMAKADLLLKFLSAQERIDPVITTLAGARLELMSDVVNLADELLSDAPINYLIAAKEVGLDLENRMTTLTLRRILGE